MNDEGIDEEDPNDAEMIRLGKRYFTWLSNNDIYPFTVGVDEDFSNIVFPKPYKKATTYGMSYDYVKIIMHNF